MKKNVILILILAAVLALAGCPTESKGNTSVDISASKGVRGIISGVVYDTVTAKPLDGVTVNIATGSVTTDGNGAYAFKDIPPGTYTVSFKKDDYTFTSKNVVVDGKEYKTIDPYGEYEALQIQLNALLTWANKGIPDYPDLVGAGGPSTGNTWDWTYQDGVWITGDGAKVTYTNGQFEINEIKLEADYSYGLPLYVIGLTPLIGSFKGKLMVYKIPDAKKYDVSLSDATPAKDVEIWFVDDSLYNVGYSDSANGTTVSILGNTVAYGPVKTNGDGNFQIDKLPAGRNLKFFTNGFTQDGFYYANNAKVYNYVFSGTEGHFAQHALTPKSNGNIDLGTLYIFSSGNYAIVTDISGLGSPVDPKKPTDSLVLKFNKNISPAEFSASIAFGYTSGGPLPINNSSRRADTMKLSASINADTVTLTPNSDSMPNLPYSVDGSQPVGYLLIHGYAEDGSEIIASHKEPDLNPATNPAAGLRVYTVEKLKLLSLDIAPKDIPASRAAVVVTTASPAFKLTFNKTLNDYAKITWGTDPNAIQADYTLSADKKSIFVWTDRLERSNDYALHYKVWALEDLSDEAEGKTDDTNIDITYQKATVYEKLELASTNLYNNRIPFVPGDVTGSAARFTNGPITIRFTRAFPAGSRVFAYAGNTPGLTYSTIYSSLPYPITDYTVNPNTETAGASSDTITITPVVPLTPGTNYVTVTVIAENGEILFSNEDLARYAVSGYALIQVTGIGNAANIEFNVIP